MADVPVSSYADAGNDTGINFPSNWSSLVGSQGSNAYEEALTGAARESPACPRMQRYKIISNLELGTDCIAQLS